jgi:Fur family ferric uptake transcriptional regulator
MPHCHTLLATLREQGFRITPQREMVVEAVAHSGQHMTAEEILAVVRKRSRTVSLTTIYRTLSILIAAGMVTRVDMAEGKVVYATIRHGPHIHLICRSCGATLTLEVGEHLAALRGAIESDIGFAANLQHISLTGLCQDCRTREKLEATAREDDEADA